MTINEATIGRAKYYPEQLPDSAVNTIGATSEVTPAILDVRQFPPLLVRLSEVAVDRVADVEMRFKVDTRTFSPLASSMFDLDTIGSRVNNFSLLARDRIYYNLYNGADADKEDFKTYYSLWVIKATVAHKLRLGIPLSPDEQKLNRDLGISATVEKGLLPLPLNEQISREFQVLQEETHSFQVTVPTVGVPVETLYPAPNQFLVLTKLSSGPSATADIDDNVRIAIDRDYVSDYVEFPTWPLGTSDAKALSREISCFIPALKELRIKLKATVQPDDKVDIRFTVLKCAMTNLFRARWGLASPDELPGDTLNKVLAGVL